MTGSHVLAAASSGSYVGVVIAAGAGVLMFREARNTSQQYGRTPFGRSPAFWGVFSFLVLIVAVPLYYIGKATLRRQGPPASGSYGAGGYAGGGGGGGGGGGSQQSGGSGSSGSSPTGPTAGGPPAGWFADPSGRHQQRYWDGVAWTEHVADAGATSVDPPV